MIPLHNHSYYSALDGWSSPEEIATRVGKLGLPGAFLTDHGTVAGFYAFRKAMKEAGLFAGYGLEAYQTEHPSNRIKTATKQGQDMFHLVLVAETYEGYKNLMRISDNANREGFHYRPRTDFEMLEKFSDGIIATTACMGSLMNDRIMKDDLGPLNQLANIFQDRLYIEIHTYADPKQVDLNERLVHIAREKGIPMVYANDAHYIVPEQHSLHEAFMAAQYNQKIDFENPMHPPCLYIMGEDDVRSSLDYLPTAVVDDAIANSDRIMEACAKGLRFPEEQKTFLPKFKPPDNKTSTEFFLDLLEQGMLARYGDEDENSEAWERAMKEAQAIVGAGLHDYFLIVQDYVNDALYHGRFVGPGRGSVGGSILAYALNITNIDPLRYDLPFERFWNPGRSAGLPDIDIDFGREGRLAQIEYVKRRYGKEKVIPIGNHSFLWPKSSLDKAVMIWPGEVDWSGYKKAKAIIEETTDAGHLKHWDDMLADLDTDQRKALDAIENSSADMQDIFDIARAFDTRLANYAIHASAVVITEADIPTYLPCRNAKEEEGSPQDRVLVTQAEMHQVEEEGFPKFDFLGVRNLDTIMEAARMTGLFKSDKEIVEHFRNNQDIDAEIPEEGWELLEREQTLGIFQIEEGQGVRRVVKSVKPRNIMDLAIASSLNRPGPLRSGDTERYIKRRNGDEPITYPHEILENILATTYGVFLFQEQCINTFVRIGYTLSEADHMRKTIGKKLQAEMDAEKPRYLERAQQFMTKQEAENIWTLIENFSKYGFNAAHSIGYAIITAWTLYAKWHWPAEFYMASIRTNPKKIGGYVEEARARGITIKGPNVAKSKATIALDEDGVIRYGYADIKGIGEAAAVKIMDNWPYASVYDYLDRCEANMGTFKILNRAGAFDEFGYRMQECPTCEGRGKRPEMVPKKSKPDELKRVLVPCENCKSTGWNEGLPPEKEEIAANEEELLGLIITDIWHDIIEEHQSEIDLANDWEALRMDKECTVGRVPGIVKEVTPTTVKTGRNKGAKMAHVTIKWVNGESIKAAVFTEMWNDYRSLLKPNRVGVFTLGKNDRGYNLKKAKVFV